MAVTVDASSPALASGTTTSLTTAGFNPPGSNILVACMNADPFRSSYTMSNNGTALTWNLLIQRTSAEASAHAHWAFLSGARTGMTVTANGGVADQHGFKLYVLNGADTTTPVGGSTSGTSLSNAFNTTAFTIQGTGSLGFVVGDDFSANGVGTTSSDTTFTAYDSGTSIAGGSGYKSLGASGGNATFNLDAFGTAASDWYWISFEILATGGGAAPLPMRPVIPRSAIQRALL